MPATRSLHELGQSLWLDHITRALLAGGTLKRYIDELTITGLTSNPTIFDLAIKGSADYDADIAAGVAVGRRGEQLFFDLALQDITQAADLFRPAWERSAGVDGWVSLEVSPALAYDTAATLASARELHARAARPNVLIKIPGTPAGLPAIEEAIFAGIPVNVTLLFSTAQYLAAAEATLRGVERRIAAGLNPAVGSVASLFISRWDNAVRAKVPRTQANTLGIAIGQQSYAAYCQFLAAPRSLRAANFGARPQRLLFASTGTKDPQASDVLYVEALAAACTVNTMPEGTLKAFAAHGRVGGPLAPDGGDYEQTLDAHRALGIDLEALAAQLQDEGAQAFVKSWDDLLAVLDAKCVALGRG